MNELLPFAPGVWRLPLLPSDGLNAYLVGDVLVDSGVRTSAGALLAALAGRNLTAHLLTHAHPDHLGASATVCETFGIPLWCGAADRPIAERAAFAEPWQGRKRAALFHLAEAASGPGHPVARTVKEGDQVADFVVIETPGHTAGHVSLWREKDGIVILGDVASHQNPLSLSSGLREPTPLFTLDPETNRRSIRKIAELRPSRIGFGHGPPVEGDTFVAWAETLEP